MKKRSIDGQGIRRICFSTLVAVYVLILAGGIVRSTGSGMGCPDWPRCFGNWIPPANESELPGNYREQYAEYRNNKNIRFAMYLSMIGLNEMATQILKDESIRVESEFNTLKTWTEYINRLIGAFVGLLFIGVFIRSLRFWKTRRWITLLAITTLIVVIFQGWIGSVVVSTNLTPWTVTLHMALALVIVLMLITLMEVGGDRRTFVNPFPWRMIRLLVICMVFLFVQIVLGTQVREAIDQVSLSVPDRGEWIGNLGWELFRHRSFSWAVLIIHLALVAMLWRLEILSRLHLVLIGLVLATILSGAGMAYFSVSPYLQPVHLLLATLTFGLQYVLLLRWFISRKAKTVRA